MAVYSIGLPDGRTLDVEADSEAVALQGAQQWFSQNQKPAEPDQNNFAGRFGGMAPPSANAPALDDELQRSARLTRGEPSNKFSYGSVYPQMVRESVDVMSQGARQAMEGGDWLEKAKGAGMAALGGLSYAASPINAALRVAVGNPVEQLTGVPRDYTEFAAGLAVPGFGLPSASLKAAKPGAPTVGALKDAYDTAKNSPAVEAVQIKPTALINGADSVLSELSVKKFSAVRAKETFSLLEDLRASDPSGVVTMANVGDLRYQLNLIIGGTNRTDAAAAKVAKTKLDDWVRALPEGDIVSGDPKAAARVMGEANRNYSAAKTAEALDKRVETATDQAATANSGMNIENRIREKVRQFLASDESHSLTGSDRDALKQFMRGTKTQNGLRIIGNLFGGGGGLGTAATGFIGAYATDSYAGAAVPLVGFGIKALSNGLATRQAAKLSETIRSNTPLGRQQKAAVEHWAKYAKAAQERPMTPRIAAMLTIQSRNLSNNLKDAGVVMSPEQIMRSVSYPKGRAEQDE
jgi:hypothetical protein